MEITKQYPDELDADTAYALLEAVVAEAGEDYVYKAPEGLEGFCRYEFAGLPSCGVGRALHRFGVLPATLADWDSCSMGSAIYAVDAGAWLTEPARQVLGAFQKAQDTACTYGLALAYAKRKLESVKVES